MAETPEDRLAALGLVLPPAPAPVANYVPTLLMGDWLYISGQIARKADGSVWTGHLGADPAAGGLSVDGGREAARSCALALLAQARQTLGSLAQITRVVRITGFVASHAQFKDHPKVVDGASDLLVEVLGEKGRHTRSSVGVAALPAGAAVEIDAILHVGAA